MIAQGGMVLSQDANNTGIYEDEELIRLTYLKGKWFSYILGNTSRIATYNSGQVQLKYTLRLGNNIN